MLDQSRCMSLRLAALTRLERLLEKSRNVRFGARRFQEQFEHGRSGRIQQVRIPGQRMEDDRFFVKVPEAQSVDNREPHR